MRRKIIGGGHLVAAAWMLASSLAAGVSRAQDAAAAEALFREGAALASAGDVTRACEKFEASERIESSSGTLLNLGDCSEQLGKTATAWAYFIKAATAARQQRRPDHEQEAERRASRLEPSLSYLTIRVLHGVPGLVLQRNHVDVAWPGTDIRLPVDPGEHRVVAKAPGYKDAIVSVVVSAHGDAQLVTVPALDAVPTAQPAPSRQAAAPAARHSPGARGPSPTRDRERANLLPWIVGGFSGASLVTGGVFGVLALSSHSAATDACPRRTGCDRGAMETRDRAEVQANVANVAIGAGAAGLAITGILLATSSSTRSSGPAAAFSASRHHAQVDIGGSF